jgi:hypothetical protein
LTTGARDLSFCHDLLPLGMSRRSTTREVLPKCCSCSYGKAPALWVKVWTAFGGFMSACKFCPEKPGGPRKGEAVGGDGGSQAGYEARECGKDWHLGIRMVCSTS